MHAEALINNKKSEDWFCFSWNEVLLLLLLVALQDFFEILLNPVLKAENKKDTQFDELFFHGFDVKKETQTRAVNQ